MPGRHPRLALAIIALVVGLAGLAGTPPIDRDEPQFAQPARQMLASGDLVDIRFQSAPLAQKPILTYWLEAASAALFGGPEHARIWAYRLPSVLAILVAALLTFRLAAILFGIGTALPAALLLTASLLVQTQAHQARADALLLAEMAAVAVPLARAHLAGSAHAYPREAALAAMFWIGLAASILTKGPVVPAIILPAAAALAWVRRDARWLGHLRARWGVPLLLLLLVPWPAAVIWRSGPSLFVQAWQSDIFPKMISGQESHGAPPLSYLATSPLTLWPASLFLPAAVEYAWRRRRDAAVVFCASVIIPGWLLFEAAPTKLPHYIMPFLPLLAALMAASCFSPAGDEPSRAARRVGAIFLLAGAACVSGAIALSLLRLGPGLGVAAAAWIAGLAATAAYGAVVA
ncbi:MAG TPA: glycosyltransferase family 39 protein, partial [Steroidobacteraceae bacterium]|nr:glycosyltransferase family 39 protein [Steroidobacteraceae bacterium]